MHSMLKEGDYHCRNGASTSGMQILQRSDEIAVRGSITVGIWLEHSVCTGLSTLRTSSFVHPYANERHGFDEVQRSGEPLVA